jgi:hypothetical protein
MVWQLFVLHATGPAAMAATLAKAGYAPTGLRMTVAEAVADIDELAPDGIAVLDSSGPDLHAVARFLDHDELLLDLSGRGGQATALLWQRFTGSHVLSVFRDGRPFRRLVRADGEIVIDEGPALPIEGRVDWTRGDDALFAVAEALVGEPVGGEAWLARATVLHRRRRRA